MRMAPRVPNAPSTFVSRWIGSGVGEADADAEAEVEEFRSEVGVAATRRVTLKTVGTTTTV